MFDPVRRKYRRAIDDAVAQKEDAETTKIPQSYPGAAASDFLPAVGFQRVERVEFHTEAGPDRLGHISPRLSAHAVLDTQRGLSYGTFREREGCVIRTLGKAHTCLLHHPCPHLRIPPKP